MAPLQSPVKKLVGAGEEERERKVGIREKRLRDRQTMRTKKLIWAMKKTPTNTNAKINTALKKRTT